MSLSFHRDWDALTWIIGLLVLTAMIVVLALPHYEPVPRLEPQLKPEAGPLLPEWSLD